MFVVCLFVRLFACLFVSICLKLCWTSLENAIEGTHVLAQCASDLCRSAAAQHIQIRDGTTIPYNKGGHYRDFFHCVGQ